MASTKEANRLRALKNGPTRTRNRRDENEPVELGTVRTKDPQPVDCQTLQETCHGNQFRGPN